MANSKTAAGTGIPTTATGNHSTETQGNYTTTGNDGQGMSLFIGIDEVMKLLGASRSTAQKCVRQVNDQQAKLGMFVFQGRCNRRMLMRHIGEGV